MTDIIALDKKLKELNDKIDALKEERAKVIAERTKYINEDTKHYEYFEDIVWEPKALNAASGFLSAFLGHRIAGYKPVAVDGVLYYRQHVDKQTPDWQAIGDMGVIDVTAPFWIAPYNGRTMDQEIRNQRAREYNGGLRQSLSTWNKRKEGQEMRKAYLETHEDPGPEYTKRNPSSLSRYGNEAP